MNKIKRYFFDCDLATEILEYLSLDGVEDFEGCCGEDGETFENLNFEECTFRAVDMRHKIFKNCNFRRCAFTDGTDLSKSKFLDCDFTGAYFKAASAIGTQFHNCDFKDITCKAYRNLDHAEFFKRVDKDYD